MKKAKYTLLQKQAIKLFKLTKKYLIAMILVQKCEHSLSYCVNKNCLQKW